MHLGRLAGDRLLVIWDGSPIHRRVEVKDFVEEAGDHIHLESLPPYAPDLNPVESVWSHLKRSLANLAAGTITHMATLARTRLNACSTYPA